MQAFPRFRQLRLLGQRTFRWALLLVMACFLGLAGHLHVHPTERSQAPAIQSLQPDNVLVATHAEETCAVCVWKAHTPYVPAQEPPVAVIVMAGIERAALMPRAPPAIALPFLRNRAPPALLS